MSSIDFGPTFTVLFTTQCYFHLAKIASIPPKKANVVILYSYYCACHIIQPYHIEDSSYFLNMLLITIILVRNYFIGILMMFELTTKANVNQQY